MSFPINTPVTFVNTATDDFIDFEAAIGTNAMRNFVVTTAGDMLVRAPGAVNDLQRLPIGTDGQVLTVSSGAPTWVSPIQGQAVFCAYVTGSSSAIPTSRNGGANPGTWFDLSGNVAPGPFVVWSTASPGVNPDSVFSTTTGVNYGIFTAPATGIYEFEATVTFDSGAGVTAGSGLPAGNLPRGTAVRQMQIYNFTTATPLKTIVKQVEASNSNSTCLVASSFKTSLTSGDRVGIRVRHDRSGTNTVTIGAAAISLPSQTSFSGLRVK